MDEIRSWVLPVGLGPTLCLHSSVSLLYSHLLSNILRVLSLPGEVPPPSDLVFGTDLRDRNSTVHHLGLTPSSQRQGREIRDVFVNKWDGCWTKRPTSSSLCLHRPDSATLLFSFPSGFCNGCKHKWRNTGIKSHSGFWLTRREKWNKIQSGSLCWSIRAALAQAERRAIKPCVESYRRMFPSSYWSDIRGLICQSFRATYIKGAFICETWYDTLKKLFL